MTRKILSIVIICALILATAACGKKIEEAPVSAPTAAAETTTNATEHVTTQKETEAPTLPTLSENYELPKGEEVESWDEEEISQNDADAEETTPDVSDETIEDTETQQNSTTETTAPVEAEEKKEGCGCEYANYLAMSPVEQEAYMESFSSPLAFIEWSKAAEAEHSTHITVIEASGEELDLSQFVP